MKNKTISILKEIISIPSFVDKNNNERKFADWLNEFLKKETNLRVITQKVEGTRVNIVATSSANPKVVLFGHTDTVPPKSGTKEPFKPRLIGDKLYGLGSVDMKSGLAIMLNQATKKYKDFGIVLTCDEEYNFKGAYALIKKYKLKPDYIINIEPTDLMVLNGWKGVSEFTLEIEGKPAHASTKNLGINAIEKAVQLSGRLQEELTKTDTNIKERGRSTLNLAYLHGGSTTDKVSIDSVGNVVPNFAKTTLEIRVANPLISKEWVTNKIKIISKELKIKAKNIKFKFHFKPMYIPRKELINFENAIERSEIPVRYKDVNKTGFYEVQLVQDKWKSKTVVFGPSPSKMCHADNEYVEVKSVEKCEKVIETFLKETL